MLEDSNGLQNVTITVNDLSDIVSDYMGESYKNFPLPFVLVFAGYAFILLLDKVLIDNHSHGDNEDNIHSHDENNPFETEAVSNSVSPM